MIGSPSGRISLGIFAHNEEANVACAIRQLQRTKWTSPAVDIFLLANGCTDRTVSIAAVVDAEFDWPQGVSFSVIEVPATGKSATWNYFVHELIGADTEAIVFADCDIDFGGPETISALVRLLDGSPDANCAVSKPVRVIDSSTKWFGRVAAKAPATYDSKTAVAGHLYCLRASFARRTWLPDGLPAEDGFVRAIVLTDLFTISENLSRIASDESVQHKFVPVDTLREWIRHESRLLVGSTINFLIYDFFAIVIGTAPDYSDAGTAVITLNSSSPGWVAGMVRGELSRRYWVVPHEYLTRRIRGLSPTQVAKFPQRMVMTGLDWAAAVVANRILRSGRGVGHW
jgi:glycosyltransferase involved in cell wall biosynthesis